jgi:hypothetical protein
MWVPGELGIANAICSRYRCNMRNSKVMVLGLLNSSFILLATGVGLEVQAGIAADQASLVPGQLSQMTKQAVRYLVEEGARQLLASGKPEVAAKLEWEAEVVNSQVLSVVDLFDLGDHRPLDSGFAALYQLMKENLGSEVLVKFHLDDADVLNYSTPVVFQPRGDRRTGEAWSREEYRKHFVPFSGVITYWVSYGGCLVATQSEPILAAFCGVTAQGMRKAVVKSVGPLLSDRVYDSQQ